MEIVKFISEDTFDEDGAVISGSEEAEYFCEVLPAGSTGFTESDHIGLTSNLDVYAPAGIEVNIGDRLEIRGAVYRVANKPFDWAYCRKPRAHPSHKPRTQILAEAVEIDG